MDLLLTIRGLAALAVVVWHSVGNHGGLPVINIPGRTAVWIFFGISGYVIAHGFIHRRYSFAWRDLKDFYINRFLRIYPLFLALSVLGWITEYLSTGVSPLAAREVPAQFLALQFDQNYILNGVFWTLGIELHFYLVAPLLAGLLMALERRRRLLLAFGLYIAMVGWIYFAIRVLQWSPDGRNILMNLPHFFMGMIACAVAAKSKSSPRRFKAYVTLACVLIGYTSWLYHTVPGRFWSAQGILLVDLAVFLLVLAHASAERLWYAGGRIQTAAAFLGVLSYGIYAWHGYLMKAIPAITPQVFLLIALSICGAYASYRLIEQPALRLKRKHVLQDRTAEEGMAAGPALVPTAESETAKPA